MATLTLEDNEAVILGTQKAARLQYYTKDANANMALLDLDPGGSVHVPVFAVGIRVLEYDLGLFDGFTQPGLFVIDADRDSYVGFHFSADDTPVVRLNGAGTVRNHTLPDVASDTFTLNAAVQTLTNKTFGASTITGSLTIADDVVLGLGTGGDIALVNRSTILAANTALTSVLIGTPVTPAVAANSLIISNVTASGDILLAGNLGGNSRAYLFVDVSADTMALMTAGVSRLFLGAAGLIAINDTSNANMTVGLTLNQGSNTNEILALKNSVVAHGRTSVAETDTFATFQIVDTVGGGLFIRTFLDANATNIIPFAVNAYSAGNADTTKSTAGVGLITLGVRQTSGDADADVVANGNIFVLRANATPVSKFIFDINGTMHSTMGTGTGIQRHIGVASIDTTAVGNVDTGEDDLITFSLPANAMSAAGKGVRIHAWGTAANNANAKTLKLYFGTQIIETFTLTVSQVDTWSIIATVWRTGSSTQDWESTLIQAGTASAVDVEVGTATQTDTAAITIKCTGEGVATNDIVQEGLLVEFVN